jgi:catechol 2,3-dioxygenase-like lactoylglutathione lyase family enzyme
MNLNQITVPVLNIESSIEFYKLLGLKLIVNSTNRYARFECPQGDSTFSLHKVDQLLIGEGVWIYFEVENLDEKFKKLKNKGVDFLTEPTDQTWFWKEAKLLDPDGNTLILYKAGENRKYPPWRIE